MEAPKDNNNYLVLDEKGLVVEKNDIFGDNVVGDINDIINKGKKIFDDKEITFDIQYENSNLIIMNNSNNKLSVCSLVNKK